MPPTTTPSRATIGITLSIVAVALALTLLWSPSGGGRPHGDEPSPTASGGPEPATAAQPAAGGGKVARLDFTFKDMNGHDVSLAGSKGKIILLNFWATWCGPCRAEIPDLIKLQQAYRKDLVVLGVVVQDPVGEKTQLFASEFGINYAVVDGNDREDVEQAYGPFFGIPTSVIIGRDGRIVKRHSGARTMGQLERDITPLL